MPGATESTASSPARSRSWVRSISPGLCPAASNRRVRLASASIAFTGGLS